MNEATEYGASFDMSNENLSQNVVVNFVDEDNSIVGEEAFMNPANSEEFTIGYYMSKDFDSFNVDMGMRIDQIERSVLLKKKLTKIMDDIDQYSIDDYNIDELCSFALLVEDITDNLNISLGLQVLKDCHLQ